MNDVFMHMMYHALMFMEYNMKYLSLVNCTFITCLEGY